MPTDNKLELVVEVDVNNLPILPIPLEPEFRNGLFYSVQEGKK